MKFAIREVILWPRNNNAQPRRVPFLSRQVNVITGESKTGKSAIIPIIDYCLASDKCTIPVETIRNACSWFGILVQTEDGQKLFARREPGEQKATADMFLLEAATVEVPTTIGEKNTTADYVKGVLDDIAGLSSLDFDSLPTSGFRARASFRDLAAFNFQPQNIVADPNVLFYKADTYEHREKLRTIFPYVLGAVTPDVLAKQHQLADLRRELRRKSQELDALTQVSERWMAELFSNLRTARELGLIDEAEARPDTREAGVQVLRRIASSVEVPRGGTSLEAINASADELVRLRDEENELSLQLSHLRQRFVEMTELREGALSYRRALRIQQERIAVSEWLKKHAHPSDCPVCGSAMGKESEALESLLKALEQVESTAARFESVPASFDREYQRVRRAIGQMTEQLTALQRRISSLEQRTAEERHRQYTMRGIARFVGRLESDLQILERIGVDSELNAEIARLRQSIAELEVEVAERRIKQRLERALLAVEANAQRLLPILDVEWPHVPVSLLVNDLTMVVRREGRDDYLWEIGSGANWLSYHLAISLGLQLFFSRDRESPVPNFIVYDQPSQVYFPRKLAERGEDPQPEPKFDDDADVAAVRKAFTAMAQAVRDSGDVGLQIIVLDHAPPPVWDGIAEVHLVDEWRGGKKLVPNEWLL